MWLIRNVYTPVLLALIGGGFFMASVAAAQIPEPIAAEEPPTADAKAVNVGPSTVEVVRSLESLRPSRPPLLREGSLVVEVEGAMYRDSATGEWRFRISEDDPDAPGYELSLLPGTLLGEMVAIVTSSPSSHVVFEVTGEVFVYRGRNYVLPTHPPRIIRHERPTGGREKNSIQAGDDEVELSPDGAVRTVPEPGGETGDSTDDIMRRLEEAAGPIAPPIATVTDRDPVLDDQRSDPTSGQGAGFERRAAKLVREGTVLRSRRGTLRRGGSGAWIFAFDADAPALQDPPFIIMPCLLLERMEEHVRQGGENIPMLLSGRVFVFENRNYLLPTIFRIPIELTRLSPAP